MIVVTGVRKSFAALPVLLGIDARVEDGEIVALIGENGAGKSTLLQIICGIHVPDTGTVSVNGHDLRSERVKALTTLGFAPENADLPTHLRAREWLSLVASVKSSRTAETPFDITPFGRTMVKDLSLGQRRRLLLASAWLGAPRTLLLDEPTNGLDAGARQALESALRQVPGGVLIATHDRGFAARMNARVVPIVAGRIGTTDAR